MARHDASGPIAHSAVRPWPMSARARASASSSPAEASTASVDDENEASNRFSRYREWVRR